MYKVVHSINGVGRGSVWKYEDLKKYAEYYGYMLERFADTILISTVQYQPVLRAQKKERN